MILSTLAAPVHSRVRLAGLVAYASLFTVVLPLALAAWTRRLDALLRLPAVGSGWLGTTLTAIGAVLMATAIVGLWFDGGGLPMSPRPPARFVARGAYRLVADPIYLGAVLVCGGVSLLRSSPAGVWIVTPVLALAAGAFVLGYERDATRARFGTISAHALRLPEATDDPPTAWERAATCVLVFLTSLALSEAASRLAVTTPYASSTTMAWDYGLPVLAWTAAVSVLAYPSILLAPLLARRRRDLRRFVWLGILATSTVVLFRLLVPVAAPSLHVVWTLIACELYARTWPRMRWAAVVTAAAVIVSCVTTGTHAIVDVLAGVIAFLVIARTEAIWAACCRVAEHVTNSWREWRVGPIRMMSHGLFAAVGGAAGVALAVRMAGPGSLWWIAGLALAAEAGAALWAQLVEGSSQLLRPYGYFGSVVAATILCAALGAAGREGWLLIAAMSVGGCVTQVLGRLRCLVQGCCHGRPTDEPWGLRYRHERSRVVRLSHLGGVPLHPTQVYSMLWTTFTALALIRLWTLAAPLPFVTGSYLVLIGIGRFVEEHYRGEPQTAQLAGLRLYQWFAIAFVIAGGGLTAVAGPPAPSPIALGLDSLPALALVAAITYVAYGVDFPAANRRFSRLV